MAGDVYSSRWWHKDGGSCESDCKEVKEREGDERGERREEKWGVKWRGLDVSACSKYSAFIYVDSDLVGWFSFVYEHFSDSTSSISCSFVPRMFYSVVFLADWVISRWWHGRDSRRWEDRRESWRENQKKPHVGNNPPVLWRSELKDMRWLLMFPHICVRHGDTLLGSPRKKRITYLIKSEQCCHELYQKLCSIHCHHLSLVNVCLMLWQRK